MPKHSHKPYIMYKDKYISEVKFIWALELEAMAQIVVVADMAATDTVVAVAMLEVLSF